MNKLEMLEKNIEILKNNHLDDVDHINVYGRFEKYLNPRPESYHGYVGQIINEGVVYYEKTSRLMFAEVPCYYPVSTIIIKNVNGINTSLYLGSRELSDIEINTIFRKVNECITNGEEEINLQNIFEESKIKKMR